MDPSPSKTPPSQDLKQRKPVELGDEDKAKIKNDNVVDTPRQPLPVEEVRKKKDNSSFWRFAFGFLFVILFCVSAWLLFNKVTKLIEDGYVAWTKNAGHRRLTGFLALAILPAVYYYCTHKRPDENPNKPPIHKTFETTNDQVDGKDTMGLAFSGGGIRSASFCLGVLKSLNKGGMLEKMDYLSSVSGGGYTASSLMAWLHKDMTTDQNPTKDQFEKAIKNLEKSMAKNSNYLFRTGALQGLAAMLGAVTTNLIPACFFALLIGSALAYLSGPTIVRSVAVTYEPLNVPSYVGTESVLINSTVDEPARLTNTILINSNVTQATVNGLVLVHSNLENCGEDTLTNFSSGRNSAVLWDCTCSGTKLKCEDTSLELSKWTTANKADLRPAAILKGLNFLFKPIARVGIWILIIFACLSILVGGGERIGHLIAFAETYKEYIPIMHGLIKMTLLFVFSYLAMMCTVFILFIFPDGIYPLLTSSVEVTALLAILGGLSEGNAKRAIYVALGLMLILLPIVIPSVNALWQIAYLCDLGKKTVLTEAFGFPTDFFAYCKLAEIPNPRKLNSFSIIQNPLDALLLVLLLLILSVRGYETNKRTIHTFYKEKLRRAFYPLTGNTVHDPKMNELPKRPHFIINTTANNTSGSATATSFTFSQKFAGGNLAGWAPVSEYNVPVSEPMAISGAAVSIDMGQSVSAPLPVKLFLIASGFTLGSWTRSPQSFEEDSIKTHLYDLIIWFMLVTPLVVQSICGPIDAYYSHSYMIACICFAFAVFLPILVVICGEFYTPIKRLYWPTPLRTLAQMLTIPATDMNNIFLSDGGHYENLAVFELIRRKCKTILSFDVGEDPTWKLEDLHSLILNTTKEQAEFENRDWYCRFTVKEEGIQTEVLKVLAGLNEQKEKLLVQNKRRILCIQYERIKLDENYEDTNEIESGTIWFVKATLVGDEPSHLHLYALKNPEFPHHSTVFQQWFDPITFHAYCDLGEHSANQLLKTLDKKLSTSSNNGV